MVIELIQSYRVVAVVAGNSEAVTLFNLSPDTQYQLTVTSVWSGRKYRSRPIVFRTLGKRTPTPIIRTRYNNVKTIKLIQ